MLYTVSRRSIKWCLLSEEHSSNAGVLGCMLAAEDPFASIFLELSLCSVNRLLSLMIKHIGCAMCYSQEASEIKLNMLESSGCCWLAEL